MTERGRRYKLRHPIYVKWSNHQTSCRVRGYKWMTYLEYKMNWDLKGKSPCEICRRNIGRYFDHDHKTGRFRGFLCSPCNLHLGLIERFREQGEFRDRIENYLLEPNMRSKSNR